MRGFPVLEMELDGSILLLEVYLFDPGFSYKHVQFLKDIPLRGGPEICKIDLRSFHSYQCSLPLSISLL